MHWQCTATREQSASRRGESKYPQISFLFELWPDDINAPDSFMKQHES
jgi:hypothetical protein